MEGLIKHPGYKTNICPTVTLILLWRKFQSNLTDTYILPKKNLQPEIIWMGREDKKKWYLEKSVEMEVGIHQSV